MSSGIDLEFLDALSNLKYYFANIGRRLRNSVYSIIEMCGKAIQMWLMLVVVICVVGGVMALPLMFLWNFCLVPVVAILEPINYWQAWGIFILMSLVVRSTLTFSMSWKS